MVKLTRSTEVTIALEQQASDVVWVLVDGNVIISLDGDTIKVWDSKHVQNAGFTKVAFTSGRYTLLI